MALSTLKPVADSNIAAIVETAILRAFVIGANNLRSVIRNPLYLASCGLNTIMWVFIRPRCVCVNCGGNVASPQA